MSDRTCLRCGDGLPEDCRLICRRCFERLPAGLRQQWRQSRNAAAKDACVSRVRHFINSLKPNARPHAEAIADSVQADVGQEVTHEG